MNLEGIFVLVTPENQSRVRSFYSRNFKGDNLPEFSLFGEYYGVKDNEIMAVSSGDSDFKSILIATIDKLEQMEAKPDDTVMAHSLAVVAKQGMRQFETGATRNLDENKLDFEGFLSPLVLERFSEYMHTHRLQADGVLRDSDNWQKGIPVDAYMKSMWRHFFDVWKGHRGLETPENKITNLCALMFNVQGMLHELIKLEEK